MTPHLRDNGFAGEIVICVKFIYAILTSLELGFDSASR